MGGRGGKRGGKRGGREETCRCEFGLGGVGRGIATRAFWVGLKGVCGECEICLSLALEYGKGFWFLVDEAEDDSEYICVGGMKPFHVLVWCRCDSKSYLLRWVAISLANNLDAECS